MDLKSSENDVKNLAVKNFPTTGFFRLPEVLTIVGVRETCWREGMKIGFYPQSVKLGKRAVGWRVEDIRELVQNLSDHKVF